MALLEDSKDDKNYIEHDSMLFGKLKKVQMSAEALIENDGDDTVSEEVKESQPRSHLKIPC